MRKLSYLFAAILMSVFSLTSKAETSVTDTENWNAMPANIYNTDMRSNPNWPQGWYTLGSAWAFSTASNCVDGTTGLVWTSSASLDSASATSYIITYAKKGTVSFMFKAQSPAILTNTNCHIILRGMTKTGDTTFELGDIIKELSPSTGGYGDINNTDFTKVEFEIPEDMWIGLNAARFYVDNYENTYLADGGGDVEIPTYTVSGTVKNRDGNAIVGATVTLTGCENAVTPEDGTFSFTDIKEGSTVTLTVSADNYNTYKEEFTVGADMNKDVVLSPTSSTIRFRFLDSLYDPFNIEYLTNGTVTLYENGVPVPGCENIRAGEEDYYSLTVEGSLASNGYTLKTSFPGYEDRDIPVYSTYKYNQYYFKYGEVYTITTPRITLKGKKVTFTAIVVNENSEYVTNAKITLKWGDQFRQANFVAESLTYVISDVDCPALAAAESVVATCEVPNMKPIADKVIDFKDENIFVQFEALPFEPTTLSGVVTRKDSENTTIAGATVQLYNGDTRIAATTTDAKGAYKLQFSTDKSGEYTIMTNADYYTMATASVNIESEAENTANIEMNPINYSFTATVADEDEVAIADAKVTLDGKELKPDAHGNFVGYVWAGDAANGGKFTVIASAKGYSPETYELTYGPNEVEKSYAFKLAPVQYSFTVTVINDMTFEPLDDAIVKITDDKGNEQTVVNEGNGKFAAYWSAETLPEGELTATISYPDFVSQSITFDFTEQTAISEQVSLEQIIRTLTVTVLDGNNNDAPVLNARVNITILGMEGYSEDADPMGDGTYVFAAGLADAKGLTLVATVTAPDVAEPISFQFNVDEGNVEKTVQVLVSGVDAIFAGEQGAKNLAGKIYVNGDAQIFTIDGKLVRVVRTQSAQEIEGLQPGLYIVAGQKMIVK